MKTAWKKYAAMLLAALLLCTSVPAAAFAAEEEYFPEDGVLAMEEDDLNAGEDIAMEEEESPVYEEEEELEEGEIVFPDDSVSDYTEDDVELGMGEEIFPEGCDSPMDEEEELGDAWPDLSELTVDAVSEEDGEDPQEGEEEELNGYPQIILSDTGAELNKGQSTNITVSYTGFTGKITMTSAGPTRSFGPPEPGLLYEEPLPEVPGDEFDWFKGYVKAIKTGGEFEITIPQVRRDLLIMDAFRESARTGKAVAFES